MKCYRNESTDPYFNLAAEQYLLDTEDDDIFMLWRNERTVVIGRNQNAYAEIDVPFVTENRIAVVRRLTGGGAVFHDLGNLNFTFIVPRKDCPELDFGRFCRPIVDALRFLGVPAELSGRNDLTAEGRKFSGNAQCVYNGKVLHHGTLLFSAELSDMAGALRVNEEKMKSKGVRSVRARVCNLSSYLPGMTVTGLKAFLENRIGADRLVTFSPEQMNAIEALKRDKYATWEWNFGVSKEYGRSVGKRFPYGTVELSFTAAHGVLTEVRFQGDYFGTKPVSELEAAMIGCRLQPEAIAARLSDVGAYLFGASPSEIAALFFS